MEERKYDFYDVKEFLKEQYGLEWKGFNIYDFDKIRKVRLSDIKGEYHFLSIYIPTQKNGHKEYVVVEVTNKMFKIITQNNPCNDKSKQWQELLADKEHAPKY